jgi:hypothetical protein
MGQEEPRGVCAVPGASCPEEALVPLQRHPHHDLGCAPGRVLPAQPDIAVIGKLGEQRRVRQRHPGRGLPGWLRRMVLPRGVYRGRDDLEVA